MNDLLTRARRSPSRVLAVLLAPFLVFVLAGCGSVTGTIKVDSPTRATMDITMLVDKDVAEAFGGETDPDKFCSSDSTGLSDDDSAIKVTGKDKGDQIECTFKGTGDPSQDAEPAVTEVDNGKYVQLDLGISGMTEEDWANLEEQGPAFGIDPSKAEVDITIQMPGKVVESSSGTISGKKVHITDLKDLMINGVKVKSEKGGGLGGVLILLLVLGLLALLALAAIAALVFFLARRKKKNSAPVPPAGFGGPAAGAAGAGAAGAANSSAPQWGAAPQGPGSAPQGPGSAPQGPGSAPQAAGSAPQFGSPNAPQAPGSAPQFGSPNAPQAPSGPSVPPASSAPQGYTPAPGGDSQAPQFGQGQQPNANGTDNPFYTDPNNPGPKNTDG